MTGARPLFGGIEAGGTKFVLAVGHSPTEILARHALPTRAPEATLRQTEAWFREQGPLAALGIASFGPAVVDRAYGSWGHIGTTPKPGWSGCDLAGHFARAFDVPVGFDTDVNGAALAESAFGAGRELASLAYVTVAPGSAAGWLSMAGLCTARRIPKWGTCSRGGILRTANSKGSVLRMAIASKGWPAGRRSCSAGGHRCPTCPTTTKRTRSLRPISASCATRSSP